MEELFNTLMDLMKSGRSGALCIVADAKGSAPQIVGAKMLYSDGQIIAGTIGGGAIEHQVMQRLPELIAAGKPALLHFNLEEDVGMKCGGTMTVYVEPLAEQHRLIIFGAGHVGSTLTPIAKSLGFYTLVIDNRPEFANRERLPQADEIWGEPYEEAVKRLIVTGRDFIVILTHGHKYDFFLLEKLIEGPHRYLGMIGSRKKAKEAMEALREKGISQEAIDKVHSPIGLPIGGSSPAEIAVSICAELVQVRNELRKPKRIDEV